MHVLYLGLGGGEKWKWRRVEVPVSLSCFPYGVVEDAINVLVSVQGMRQRNESDRQKQERQEGKRACGNYSVLHHHYRIVLISLTGFYKYCK